MKRTFILSILLLISSCSLFKSDEHIDYLKNYEEVTDEDYIEHLSKLTDQLFLSKEIKIVRLGKSYKDYFDKLIKKISEENELLFKKNKTGKVYIIKDKRPFYFSLPGGNLFFSLGLFKKYLKNEEIFVSVFTYEYIKSIRNIYLRKRIIPTGHIQIQRILALVDIPIEQKDTINKWAFLSMKRAGFDAGGYLSWLQLKNKNSVDFRMQLGDPREISIEEFNFKNFLVKGNFQDSYRITRENSSEDFYSLISALKQVE